jgi:glycine cleavage system H protein
MNIPGDFRYTKDHLWLKEDNGAVTCGITDHAQELLDEVSVVELPEVGLEVEKEDILVTIESLKSVLDILAPVKGKVAEVNEALKDNPGLINTSPYGDGWIVKLSAVDAGVLSGFMTADHYRGYIEED